MKNKKTCKEFIQTKMNLNKILGGYNLSDKTGSAGGYTDSANIDTKKWDVYTTKLIDIWESQEGADRPDNSPRL